MPDELRLTVRIDASQRDAVARIAQVDRSVRRLDATLDRTKASTAGLTRAQAVTYRRNRRLQRATRDYAADWDRLPAILADPETVPLDTRKGGGRVLVIAFSPADGDRKGKVVVRSEFSARHRRRTRVSNAIRSAG